MTVRAGQVRFRGPGRSRICRASLINRSRFVEQDVEYLRMPGNRALAGSRVRRLRHSRATFLSCFPADGGNPYLLFVQFAATSAGSPARKRTENSPVNGQPDGFIGNVSRGTRPDSVDRELPRECVRSYMRIGKILGLEARFVTTAIIAPARWRGMDGGERGGEGGGGSLRF